MDLTNRRYVARANGAAAGDLQTQLVQDRQFTALELVAPVEALHDPFLFREMEEAVLRIVQVIEAQEEILIYGDYDCDGLTSTALLLKFFQHLGVKSSWYIPNRLSEGYGISEQGLAEILQSSASLIITVDCGITEVEAAEAIKAAGKELIITDHHQVQAKLPEAVAILNPHVPGETYPFANLAGVGVAFKLISALAQVLNLSPELRAEYLALAALGTIADIMPLRGENRIIVKEGLKALQAGANIGLQVLAQEISLNTERITAQDLAFYLAPRLNAVGRLGDTTVALDLLITASASKATEYAREIEGLNQERKNIEQRVVQQAQEQIAEKPELLAEPLLCLSASDWHLGILGIVAARLSKEYNKPCLILGLNEAGLWQGSGRSPEGLNLYNILAACQEQITYFGGHARACGLSLKPENYAQFTKEVQEAARQEIAATGHLSGKVFYYDVLSSGADLNLDSCAALEVFEPFGEANPTPQFLLPAEELVEIKALGQEQSVLKLKTEHLEAIGFGFGQWAQFLRPGMRLSLLGELEINEWQGRKTLQLRLSDFAFSTEYAELVGKRTANESLDVEEKLNGQDLIFYWQVISILVKERKILSFQRLASLLSNISTRKYSESLVKLMNTIFQEAGLLVNWATLDGQHALLGLGSEQAQVKLSETTTAKSLIEQGILEI